MKNKKTITDISVVLFFILQAVLGYLLQIKSGDSAIYLRYATVIAACLFCFSFAERSVAYVCTQIGLIFTVFADRFLVLENPPVQLPAILFFSGAQTAYFLRIYLADKNVVLRRVHLITRIAVTVIALAVTFAVLGANADAVALVSVFYYANLILNAVFSFTNAKQLWLLGIGFLLFIGCDTVIGFAFLDEYLSIPADSVIYDIINPGFDLAWAFYVPSQALISASLWKRTVSAKENIS